MDPVYGCRKTCDQPTDVEKPASFANQMMLTAWPCVKKIITEFKLEPRNTIHKRKRKGCVSCLTLAVFPRRPTQKGFIILDAESTALWAAILILQRWSRV